MTKVAGAAGGKVLGPTSRVSTGAGIVTTKQWFKEALPFGQTLHIGLADTPDAISAGQVNAERGIETSWLAPPEVPASKPGMCILHKPSDDIDADQDFNHIVWQGSHEILIPEIVANTPEVRDDQ